MILTGAYLADGGAGYNDGKGWEPIGDDENRFTGSLDGDDYSINNLFINRPESIYVGLFSYVDDAEISNLSLLNVDVTGDRQVAALAGLYVLSG